MHTFWLRSSPAEDAGIPAKPGSNPVSPSSRSLKSGLALTRIGQVVAITAGKRSHTHKEWQRDAHIRLSDK
jgi:hypothetical protein